MKLPRALRALPHLGEVRIAVLLVEEESAELILRRGGSVTDEIGQIGPEERDNSPDDESAMAAKAGHGER